MKHLGDIKQINGAEIEPVDCITAGSPCQDLSVAGKRAGLAGERSGLFMDQMRIIKEMRNADGERGRSNEYIRPRFLVWENVPGALTSGVYKGADFRCVLEEVIRVVEEDAVIPEPPKEGWHNSGCILGDGWSVAWRIHDAQFWGVPQRRKRIALVADFGGRSAPEILFIRKGLSRDTEKSGTEKQNSTKTVKRCVDKPVCYGVSSFNSNAMMSKNPLSGIYEAGTSRTLDNNGGNPSCNQGGMIVIEGNGIRPSHKGDGFAESETMYTLNSTEHHAIATYQKVCGTLDCCLAKGTSNQLAAQNMFVADGYNVRRLTPLECERLQGFPDCWTDIGEWTDTNGKLHKESSDSARYKALGNSIALPFWFYLLRRISAQYERPATLGSLFDGIGGFPLCWERCNGKGTARWASEIEEFPIAVTKYHFGEE